MSNKREQQRSQVRKEIREFYIREMMDSMKKEEPDTTKKVSNISIATNIESISKDIYFIYQAKSFQQIGLLLIGNQSIILIDVPRITFSFNEEEKIFCDEIESIIEDRLKDSRLSYLLILFSHAHIDHTIPLYKEIFEEKLERYLGERLKIRIFPLYREEDYFNRNNHVTRVNLSFKNYFTSHCEMCEKSKECLLFSNDLINDFIDDYTYIINMYFSQGCDYTKVTEHYLNYAIKQINDLSAPFNFKLLRSRAHHPHLKCFEIGETRVDSNKYLKKIIYLSDSLPPFENFMISPFKDYCFKYDHLKFIKKLKKKIKNTSESLTILSSHPVSINPESIFNKFMFICEKTDTCEKDKTGCDAKKVFRCNRYNAKSNEEFINILKKIKANYKTIKRDAEGYGKKVKIKDFEISGNNNKDGSGTNYPFSDLCKKISEIFYDVNERNEDTRFKGKQDFNYFTNMLIKYIKFVNHQHMNCSPSIPEKIKSIFEEKLLLHK